ncbi:MAG: VOC family protein [Chloroflexi bacterium]|nr:VOC family protein [Chloroflexota bacterium]MBF6606837.1 VOC family protein [Chloroflexota bacterium]
MGAPIAFFEVISPDSARAQRFYGELFGWKIDADPSLTGYALVDTGAGEGAVGGGIGQASEAFPSGVKIYLRVADLAAYLARAEQLGGRTLLPPMDLPSGYGRIAIFADPDGNPVGLWA